MSKQELTFKEIAAAGNFVAWDNNLKGTKVPAIALMVTYAWFEVAINCDRDEAMGVMDVDGVYSRHWVGDNLDNVENLRLATEQETFLYLQKVGGLSYAMGSHAGNLAGMHLVAVDGKGHYKVEGAGEMTFEETYTMTQKLTDMDSELKAAKEEVKALHAEVDAAQLSHKKEVAEAVIGAHKDTLTRLSNMREQYLDAAADADGGRYGGTDEANSAIVLHKAIKSLSSDFLHIEARMETESRPSDECKANK